MVDGQSVFKMLGGTLLAWNDNIVIISKMFYSNEYGKLSKAVATNIQ